MFYLSIETDNAAFDPHPGAEVARLLRAAADRIDPALHGGVGMAEGGIRDTNGNTVGGYKFTD